MRQHLPKEIKKLWVVPDIETPLFFNHLYMQFMQKIVIDSFCKYQKKVKKVLLIMKMLIVLIMLCCLQVTATGFSQNTVTLSAKNIPIKSVFNLVEKQTGYRFLYHEDEKLNAIRVSIHVRNMSVNDVVVKLVRNTGYDFRITENRLILLQPVKSSFDRVTGIVRDSTGAPLDGVSISIKGKSTGTSTDAEGRFSLEANQGDVLVFSRVGMIMQELIFEGQGELKITMQYEEARSEDDVVVVAYGRQKKATLTGAIASISTREIKQSPAANLSVALTGRLPGLIAQQRSGEPGRDETLLFMRGRGTLNGQSPLILVDGVERDIPSLDPNEVETVTILKDASSTALFGVRGANGVILVTTRRGTETIPTVSLTAEQGMQTFSRWPTVLNSYDWATLKNQAWKNDNPNPTAAQAPPYSEYALERFQKQDWPDAYPNNNWVQKLMNKWVSQQRYNLTINGRGSNVAYFVNIGILDQGGQWKIDPEPKTYDPQNFMKRYNFRSNIDATLNKSKTLKTFLNASGFLERVNGPFVEARFNNSSATTEIISRILQRWPVVQPGPLTKDGQVLIGSGSYQESPWAEINRSGYRKETRSNVTATWGMEQDFSTLITKGLSAKFMASFDTRAFHYLNGNRQYQFWEQVIDPNLKGSNGFDSVYYRRIRPDFDNTPLTTSTSSLFQSFFDAQLQVNYARTFNTVHSLNVLLLAQQQSQIKAGSGSNIPEVLPYNVRGLASRIGYAFDNRYIVEFNAGYNGSEQFAKGNRYGFFPSISGAWNLSNEKFWTINSVVNNFKLRGSYGLVGNDKIGNTRFLYLDNVYRSGGGVMPNIGRGQTVVDAFFGNPNVQWETAKKANIGLDFSLLKSIDIVVDVFSEKRENILLNRQTIPSIIGLPSSSLAPYNIGKINNKGWEVEITYTKNLGKDLFIITKANASYNDNKIIFRDELHLDSSYAYRYSQTGYSIGQQWGYNVLGFYNSQQQIDEMGIVNEGRGFRPGDFIFEDLNGDKRINNKDLMPIGYSTVPKFNWGWATTVNYKNFDLSFLFQGAGKVSGNFIDGGAYLEQYDFRSFHMHAWTPERAASGEKIEYPALSLATSASNNSNSFTIQNKSYIRLKNIEIGYNLPARIAGKYFAKKTRIYANALNLLTWDKQKVKDWDPETFSSSGYPILKIINFGLNVTF